jgi:peptidyl-prolyl cis-trans isomerase SurA
MMSTPMAQRSEKTCPQFKFPTRPLGRNLLAAIVLGVGASVCTSLLVGAPQIAEAAIVERIVAVVGEKAILLTDLRERSLPLLLRVHASVPEGPQRTATISQVYQTVLARMVDEELEDQAADKSGITVTAKEIDDALARVSAQNRLTVNQVLVEAKRSGLSVQGYRDELRRQLLQAKMTQLRLRGRVRVTETDIDSAYRSLAIQERLQQTQRTLRLRIPVGQNPAEQAKQRELAESLSAQAQAGADFRALIEEHATSSGSGLSAPLPPLQEPKPIQRASLALDVGETSPPIRHGGDWVIIQVIERPPSQLPPLADVREEMYQQVYMEKMATARDHWLEGLRRRTHVDIRL